jgi:hypothetical protein
MIMAMKKIMLMLALSGVFATVSAQTTTSDPSYPAGTTTTSTQEEDKTMGTGTNTDRDKTYSDQSGTDQTGTQTGTVDDQDDKSGTMQDDKSKKKSGSDQGDRMSGTDKSRNTKAKSSDRMDDQGDRVSGTEKSGAKSKQSKDYQGGESDAGKGKRVNPGEKATTVTTYTHTPDDKDKKDKKDKKYRKDMDRDKTDVSVRDRDRHWDNDQDDDVSVPDKVRNAFNGAYTNARASWKREGNNFRAMFRNDRDKDALTTIVVYDKDGNVLVTERELKSNNCPEEIEKFCSRDKRIWKVETKGAPIKYLIQDDDEHMWYDSKGNRIGGSDRDHDVGAVGEKPYEK